MSSFRTTIVALLSIAALAVTWPSASADSDPGNSTLACFFEENAIECAAQRIDGQLDEIQKEEPTEAGKPAEPPISQVIAETRDVLAEGVEAVNAALSSSGEPDDAVPEEDIEEVRDIGEARKKKLHKKKKKALQKILMVAMVLKAKLSLLLQLFSAHLQVKFFAIALLSLILNAARFWLDLKKGGHPSKVIYYEHAQHQHHYDHEDEHEHSGGYWGRSSDDAHDLAYGGHDEQYSES